MSCCLSLGNAQDSYMKNMESMWNGYRMIYRYVNVYIYMYIIYTHTLFVYVSCTLVHTWSTWKRTIVFQNFDGIRFAIRTAIVVLDDSWDVAICSILLL